MWTITGAISGKTYHHIQLQPLWYCMEVEIVKLIASGLPVIIYQFCVHSKKSSVELIPTELISGHVKSCNFIKLCFQ